MIVLQPELHIGLPERFIPSVEGILLLLSLKIMLRNELGDVVQVVSHVPKLLVRSQLYVVLVGFR